MLYNAPLIFIEKNKYLAIAFLGPITIFQLYFHFVFFPFLTFYLI